jgi:hypothetical protein
MTDIASKRLSLDVCRAKAQECQELARHSKIEEHRTMLLHMSETWLRVGTTLPSNGTGQ